jgi:DNA-directed RNA polymerase subunit RPC12/RpoP
MKIILDKQLQYKLFKTYLYSIMQTTQYFTITEKDGKLIGELHNIGTSIICPSCGKICNADTKEYTYVCVNCHKIITLKDNVNG